MTTRLTTCWVIAPAGANPEAVDGLPHGPSRAAATELLHQAAAHGDLDAESWAVLALPHTCWLAGCTACEVPLDSEGHGRNLHYRGWWEVAETTAECGWHADAVVARIWCPNCLDGRWTR